MTRHPVAQVHGTLRFPCEGDCGRAVPGGHAYCCTPCRRHDGEHDGGCDERQQTCEWFTPEQAAAQGGEADR